MNKPHDVPPPPSLAPDIASLEAEQGVLSSILIDPSALIEVDSILKSEADFFLYANRIIYGAMLRVKQRGDAIDLITLADDLENTGDLENLGGRTKLLDLMNSNGTSVHASVYAQLVARAAIRRRMLEANDKIRQFVYDESLNIDEVRALSDATWLNVTSDITHNQGAWMAEVISEIHDEVEAAMRHPERINGLSTGLRFVDELTLGFEPEQLIVLAGRPGMGKSAAMDNMALNMAKRGIPVFYATSERSKKQVVRRMSAIFMGINTYKLKTGNMNAQDMARFTHGMGAIAKLPIYFDDNPMPRPRDVYAQADWMIKRHGCKIILFDGMYRSETGDPNIDKDDRKKYGTVALQLKTMARSLHVPVLTTHQLSRAVEQRQDKRPVMSDLRESGRIEEEADKIIFLYRDEVYNDATEFPNQCDWILAKHRDGATGVVSTHYEKTLTKFSDGIVQHHDLLDD